MVLVEAAGIEPASRDISVKASTRVLDLLIFAAGGSDQEDPPLASASKILSADPHAKSVEQPAFFISGRGRAPPSGNVATLGSHCQWLVGSY